MAVTAEAEEANWIEEAAGRRRRPNRNQATAIRHFCPVGKRTTAQYHHNKDEDRNPIVDSTDFGG